MAKPGQNQLNLPLLYADLKRCGDAQNYEKAIKTAESSKFIKVLVLPSFLW